MGEHTPTPWTCRPRPFDDWGFIRGADDELACIARGHSDKEFDEHRRDKTDPYAANAAFIVKAVNSHPELVKALEFYATAAGTGTIEGIASGDVDLARASEALTEDCGDVAREALAKVQPT